MHVTIRDARHADAADLTHLARRAKASWGYPQAWLREWESQLCISAEYIVSNSVFVAAAGEVVLGVIALENSDEPEIAHLWVAPERQGQGVGRQLVEHVLDVAKARGWHSLRIESDPNAQPFYEGLGAVQVGEIPAPVCGVERVLPVFRLPV